MTADDILTWPTTTAAAAQLNVSPAYTRRLVANGTLRTVRLPTGAHLVDPASIASYQKWRSSLTRDGRGFIINRRRARWAPAGT
jgi:excisionase family DNA binding protein